MTGDVVHGWLYREAIVAASVTVASVTVSEVGAETVTVDGHHPVVVPAFKAFSVLFPDDFMVGTPHGQKDGRLGHAAFDFSLAYKVLVFGA